MIPWLTLIIFLPLAAAGIVSLFPKGKEEAVRRVSMAALVIDFLLMLKLFFSFNAKEAGMQFVEHIPWIRQFGISYYVGIDGISILLVMLTAFISPLALLSSWKSVTEKVKGYCVTILLLQTGMLGVFCSLDLFLFYIFWEAMLIPMYLLIGIWGGPRRIYAAIKFILYTMAGSVLMLISILVLYFWHGSQTGAYTFDLLTLYGTSLPANVETWLFLGFFLAFAIKVPLFPFHTWLPDAHVEAPTAGSVILAGILLKMGTYGFLRFNLPLFPSASVHFVPLVSILALIGIIYGALVAMVQPDLKKLVAYSSVSHLGFVMLGIFTFNMQGIQGGLIQMINHGLSTGALFLIVGMVYERRHTRMISDFGGLAKVMPLLFGYFLIVTLSSIGLPGLNGFVGEFLILIGTFRANPVYAVIAATGVILSAVYMLWMFQRVMFGKVERPENQKLKDLSLREKLVLIPIIIFIFWLGVYPKPFLKKTEASIKNLITQVTLQQEGHR